MDIDKIINIIRNLREQAVMGAPTNAVGTGQVAGTKEAGDNPPVRKKKKEIYLRRTRFPKNVDAGQWMIIITLMQQY